MGCSVPNPADAELTGDEFSRPLLVDVAARLPVRRFLRELWSAASVSLLSGSQNSLDRDLIPETVLA